MRGGRFWRSSLYIFLKKTDVGKAIRAASEEREGAAAVGIKREDDQPCFFRHRHGLRRSRPGAFIAPFFYLSPYVGRLFLLTTFMVVVMGGL